MKRLLALGACLVLAAAAGAGTARATNECRGLMVCVPVAGPWVVVPAAARRASWLMTCPRGYIVGGLDAELSDRALQLTFEGALGSPVNPGTTTSRTVFVTGLYTGRTPRTATFRPHVGCIPAAGGGGSPPPFRILAAAQAFPPGRPAVRRARLVRALAWKTTGGAQSCAPNERLLAGSHAVGITSRKAPPALVATSVAVKRATRGRRVVVGVSASDALGGFNAAVQVQALCAVASR